MVIKKNISQKKTHKWAPARHTARERNPPSTSDAPLEGIFDGVKYHKGFLSEKPVRFIQFCLDIRGIFWWQIRLIGEWKGDYCRHTCAQLVKITIIITAIEAVAFCIGYQAIFGVYNLCNFQADVVWFAVVAIILCNFIMMGAKETKVTKTSTGDDEEAWTTVTMFIPVSLDAPV